MICHTESIRLDLIGLWIGLVEMSAAFCDYAHSHRDRPGIEPKHKPSHHHFQSRFLFCTELPPGSRSTPFTHVPRDGPGPSPPVTATRVCSGVTRHVTITSLLGARAGCQMPEEEELVGNTILHLENTHHLTIGSDNNNHHKMPHSADYCSPTPR